MLFDNCICAFFQYICYAIVYLLIMKLIKDISNEDSDKFS